MRYRSKFEARCAKALGPSFAYETTKLPYVLKHTYLPDFVNAADKVIVEAKGRFTGTDRSKMLAVKQAHPDWTIVLWFQEPNRPIRRGSKVSNEQWARQHGFLVMPAS